MSDVQSTQADVADSQAVQQAFTAAQEAANVAQGVVQPTIVGIGVEPANAIVSPTASSPDALAAAKAQTEADNVETIKAYSPTTNSGAALSEQRAAFKVGAGQAGNAMDTMHGSVNHTWPPKAR